MEDQEKQKFLDELKRAQESNNICAYYIKANVYRDANGSDCTNGGASSRFLDLYVFTDRISIEAARLDVELRGLPPAQCFIVRRRNVFGNVYKHFAPVDADLSGKWVMMGGNFAYTCDSRWHEVTGSHYPLPVHDRTEEYER